MFHKELKNLDNCVAKKSRANPHGLTKDEMLTLCKSLGLPCNTKSTKAAMCELLIQYYEDDDAGSVSSKSSASSSSSKSSASKSSASRIPHLSLKKLSLLPLPMVNPKKEIDLEECSNKKTAANPNGNSRDELVAICKDLNIKHTTKTTKIELCRLIKAYYDQQKEASPTRTPSPMAMPFTHQIRSPPLSPSAAAVPAPKAKRPIFKLKRQSAKAASREREDMTEHQTSDDQEQEVPARKYTETYTLTFGDQAENHKNMQIIGKMRDAGFNKEDLDMAAYWFNQRGLKTEMIDLRDYLPEEVRAKASPAWVLVIRNAIKALTGASADQFYDEQARLPKDKQAVMYGRVVNKKARHNLCFGEQSQEPNYAEGKGRVVAFNELPLLKVLRDRLPETIGDKARDLVAEGNYYHIPAECGIGWHGDSERRIVIALRLGLPMSMQYQWYHRSRPVGETCKLVLGHGDVYYMSEKAVGQDWKSPSQYTLRHAAGAKKYTDYKPPTAKTKKGSPAKGSTKKKAKAAAAPDPDEEIETEEQVEEDEYRLTTRF